MEAAARLLITMICCEAAWEYVQLTDAPVLETPVQLGLLARVDVCKGSLVQYEGMITMSCPEEGIGSSGVNVSVIGE